MIKDKSNLELPKIKPSPDLKEPSTIRDSNADKSFQSVLFKSSMGKKRRTASELGFLPKDNSSVDGGLTAEKSDGSIQEENESQNQLVTPMKKVDSSTLVYKTSDFVHRKMSSIHRLNQLYYIYGNLEGLPQL